MATTFRLLIIVQSCAIGFAMAEMIANRPPMGWIPWAAFMCNIDCVAKQQTCISESLILQMADRLVHDGYRDVGYTRINLDDCWSARQRGKSGALRWDETRFPRGIPWLAQRVHEMGLKFGIYANAGEQTCQGFPGSRNHFERDAATFARWKVDMVKLDGCFTNTEEFDNAYTSMATALNDSNRQILFSCSWPYYVWEERKITPPYDKISKTCHIWRNFHDVEMSWKSIESIIDFYDRQHSLLSAFHKPGHWNDPDMLIIGSDALTPDQARAQMAMWCLWSAPLFMSNDLRTIQPVYREILLNAHLIAMDQDPLGDMGKRVANIDDVAVYTKRMMPVENVSLCTSYGIVLLNGHVSASKRVIFKLEELRISCQFIYEIYDLFAERHLYSTSVDQEIEVNVPPTGVVALKATIISGSFQAAFANEESPSSNTFFYLSFGCLLAIVCILKRRRCR